MNKNILKNKNWIHIGIFLLFFVVSFGMNWSIVIGENLMKWDIWQAEYPFQVLMSEAIENHTLPLWNPLMRYGSPTYSVLGTPVWYFCTLILAWIGYTPATIAVCYAIHVAIGGFGMYLLAYHELKKDNSVMSVSTYCASFLIGLFFCGSGVFLSNAQHIMIIISAAWIPYVFLLVRKYLEEKHLIYALGAGLCAAQLLMGGYPELFFDLFLFLIPYSLYFGYQNGKELIKNILYCARRYIVICIFTVIAGAVTLLPFLCNMGLITRGNGLGQIVAGYSPISFLSVLFPKLTESISVGEISMVNYYIGVGTILLIPMIAAKKQTNKKLYLSLAATAFLLCMGENSFLHTLLYRFCPMYSNFRFATLNRVFIAVFMLLTLAPILQILLEEGKISKRVLQFDICITGVVILVGGITAIIGKMGEISGSANAVQISAFAESAIRLTSILIAYLVVFWAIYQKTVSALWRKGVVVALVVTEVFAWSFWETPITIAAYRPGEYSWNQTAQDAIEKEYNAYENRQRGVNFAGHKRSTSKLNSKKIVFHQTFDEEGYCSFLLSAAEDFKQTYVRNIIEQNPEIYFTNNIVTSADMSYDEWVNKCDIVPEQIYVDGDLAEKITSYQKLEPEITDQAPITVTMTETGFVMTGAMSAGKNNTGRIRIYWSSIETNPLQLGICFTDSEGVQQVFSGEFLVYEQNGILYTDIYFPSLEKEYQQLQIEVQNPKVLGADFVQTERMTSDKIVDVSWFGFNSIQMTVNAPTEGYVTVLQSKHKGWTAYVDGEQTEINLVDNCFMGLHVTEGEHTIEMRFRPKEWFVGGILSVGYLGVTLIVLVAYLKKSRKNL